MTDRRAEHLANGPVVAHVRRWLQILDDPNGHYGDVKILSTLYGRVGGEERELTVDHIRTLLAEHDAYRSEARPQRREDPDDGMLPDTFLTFVEACITGDEHSIEDPDLRPSVISHGAYDSGWDVFAIWDECQAKRKILANYRSAVRQLEAARGLAELDARYPDTPPERDERPSDDYLHGRLAGAHHALMAIAQAYRGRPGYRRALEGGEPAP